MVRPVPADVAAAAQLAQPERAQAGLAACASVVGLVFGMRPGFFYLAASAAAVALVGVPIHRGLLTDLEVIDPLSTDPRTWSAQIAGFVAFTAVVLLVAGTVQSGLARALSAASARAEDVRKSEQRFRLVADNMRDVLFFRDMDLNLKFVSPSVERVFGYSVEVFDSAETAVSVYTRRWTDIDLVILDLVLPGMNGTQAMDVIRSVNPDAPVLLVSGYTADDEIRERLRDGRTEFLEKPFLLADLAQALARLMG